MKKEELISLIKAEDLIIQSYSALISEATTRKFDLQKDLYVLETGFAIGDTLQFKDGRFFKTGQLTGFRNKYGRVLPILRLHKKDGKLGERLVDTFYSDSELTKVSLTTITQMKS